MMSPSSHNTLLNGAWPESLTARSNMKRRMMKERHGSSCGEEGAMDERRMGWNGRKLFGNEVFGQFNFKMYEF